MLRVGRYVSLEKLIEGSKDAYCQALARSTVGWHEGDHDLGPWVGYFLGVVSAAQKEFEDRTAVVVKGRRGSKQEMVKRSSRARSPAPTGARMGVRRLRSW